MANPIKKLFGEIAIYGLSSIVGRLLNYLLVPLYTYVFINPADYGVVSELYAWVAFLIVILTFGMETAFFKFIQNEGDKKNVLVFSPAFTADCLETIIEIGDEYKELFEESGGENLDYVESLNYSDLWADAIIDIIK